MAGSFYEQILQGLGKDAPLPEINGGTRLPGGAGYDVPASGLDEATKARLVAQRAADSAAVNASRAAAASPEAAAAAGVATDAAPAAAKGFGARAAGILNPNITGGGVKLLAKGALAAAPVIGGLQAATASKEEVQHEAVMSGLDYNTFGGRLGANLSNFLRKTGDAATFGLAGRLGRVLGGGSFFDDDAAAPVAAAAPERVGITPEQTLSPGESVVPAGATEAAAAPAASDPVHDSIRAAMDFQPPQAPQTRLIPRGPARDSGGFIQRTSGGTSVAGIPVEGQDGPGERIELPSGTTQRFGVRRPSLADNMEYQHERNAARADQRVRIEGAKLGVSLIGAGKRGAEEQKIHILGGLAAEHLRKNPGDVAGAAAIMSGKDIKESVGSVASPTGSTGVLTRKNTVVTMDANGKPVEQKIFDQPTEADVAKMKANAKNGDFKNSFIRRFGQDAYKTHIGGR